MPSSAVQPTCNVLSKFRNYLNDMVSHTVTTIRRQWPSPANLGYWIARLDRLPVVLAAVRTTRGIPLSIRRIPQALFMLRPTLSIPATTVLAASLAWMSWTGTMTECPYLLRTTLMLEPALFRPCFPAPRHRRGLPPTMRPSMMSPFYTLLNHEAEMRHRLLLSPVSQVAARLRRRLSVTSTPSFRVRVLIPVCQAVVPNRLHQGAAFHRRPLPSTLCPCRVRVLFPVCQAVVLNRLHQGAAFHRLLALVLPYRGVALLSRPLASALVKASHPALPPFGAEVKGFPAISALFI